MADNAFYHNLYYDGVFSAETGCNEGGTRRALLVDRSSTLEELSRSIQAKTGLDASNHDVSLYYRCALDSPSSNPLSIIDDEDLIGVLLLARNDISKVPSLFVISRNKGISASSE